jgi:hypothetical protein
MRLGDKRGRSSVVSYKLGHHPLVSGTAILRSKAYFGAIFSFVVLIPYSSQPAST